MEPHLLLIQARVLHWVGFALLAIGLYLEHEPLTSAWRAAAGALVAMIAAGYFLRQILGVIQERMVTEETERQMQAAAVAAGTPPAKPGTRPGAGTANPGKPR